MSTPRVYLDTSVISHLDQPKKPIEQEYSLRLWDAVIRGEYEVWISEVVLMEIKKCEPEKVERLTDYLTAIKYQSYILTDEAIEFAKSIIEKQILPSRCIEDSQHIAAAIFTKSDYLLSWNLKHLANSKTNEKIRFLVVEEYNQKLTIVKPSVLFERRIVI
jgi:predicted nucleic acid-binding protein